MRRRLGTYLAHLRRKVGKTQWEVCTSFGYDTAQYLSNCERGVCLPNDEFLAHLARSYRRPLRDLIDAVAEEKVAEIEEWKRTALKLGRAG